MKLFRSLRAVAAVAVAGALVTGGLLAPQSAQAATPGDIDVNRQGSLTIHKLETPIVNNNQHNGTLLNPAPSNDPVSLVEFKVRKINVDLSTQAGWNTIKTMTPAQAATQLASGANTSWEKSTGIDGIATFQNLPVGAYLVTEGLINYDVLDTVDPFIVTIPFPSKDNATGNKSWLYDVHVYPKNAVAKRPTKAVDDTTAYKSGDIVKWTITQTIPKLVPAKPVSELVFIDILDARLRFVSGTLKVNGVAKNYPVTQMTFPLQSGGTGPDYAAIPQKIIAVDSTANTVVAKMGNDALQLTEGQVVTLELNTKVVDMGGKILNTGHRFFNDIVDERLSRTNDVYTYWGDLEILKVSAGDNVPLKGAVFEIYTDSACSPTKKLDIPVTKLTTGANGKLPNPLLLKKATYYVKEVTAPLGYVIPTQNCNPVTLNQVNPDTYKGEITITNEKTIVPNLPLTGSQGQLLLLIVGGGILAAGAITLVVVRIRRGY